MRNCLVYFSFLFYFLFFTCPVTAQLQKIYLNPKIAASGKQSQFIDSIRFIPLEAKEDIDLSRYNYITITPNYFIIVDYPEKNILLYAKSGAFVRKLSYKSLGEGMSPDYDRQHNRYVFFGDNKNYDLTPKDRIEITLDWNNPRNKKYFKKYIIDLNDSAFALKKENPGEKDILKANHFYEDYYWRGQITTSDLYKDSLDYELKIYKGSKLLKGYFPYNHVNEPRYLFTQEGVALNNSDIPGVHMVTRPFCDTVYRLVNDSLLPAYQVVLPLENSLPATFYTKPFKNKTERDNFERNNGWMLHQLHNFYETPRFIFFSVRYLSNFETYVYQKQSQVCYKTKNIRPDSTQFNLSLLSDFGIQKNGDRFYKSVKAGDLLAFFDTHKEFAVPKELEAYINSKPGSSAPVIVEFKFKN